VADDLLKRVVRVLGEWPPNGRRAFDLSVPEVVRLRWLEDRSGYASAMSDQLRIAAGLLHEDGLAVTEEEDLHGRHIAVRQRAPH